MSRDREKRDRAADAAEGRKSPSRQPKTRSTPAELADDPFVVFDEWDGALDRKAYDRALRDRLP